jgi:hypothetical protein
MKQSAAKEAQHRVAEIAMQRRHGLGTDASTKAIAHDEVGTRGAIRTIAQLGEEAGNVRELVAVVGSLC